MVKILFDTNVLVGALVPQHPTHQVCAGWLRQVRWSTTDRRSSGSIQGYVGMHSMAELYSVLTKLPLTEKITPVIAQTLILTNLEPWVKVSLDFEDYCAAIDRVTQAGMVSGGIFDALIAQAAVKAEVDRILTFNIKDFRRLGDEVSQLIQIPE
jgi:predicted nucleic acid-binding protein